MEPMSFPVISAALAGVLLILQQVLMLSAGTVRARTGKGVGVDGDVQLERKVRRHGNLAENAAIFVIGLTLLELLIGTGLTVEIFAVVFLIARLAHALAFTSLRGSHGKIDGQPAPGPSFAVLMRASGATLTALTGIVLGGWILVAVWQHLPL